MHDITDQLIESNNKQNETIRQLIALSQRGHAMPWVEAGGIAPFQRKILEELVKPILVPGSIGCRLLLEEEFDIDKKKISASAEAILGDDECLDQYSYCRVATKTIEKEVLQYLSTDPAWAERLLARYAACILRGSCCHIESVNSLLSITYKAEREFHDYPVARVIHLLEIIEAWKSGVLSGIAEECIKIQDKYTCRAGKVCGSFIDTVTEVASIYDKVRIITRKLSSEEISNNGDLSKSAEQLKDICDEFLSTLNHVIPFIDED